ncbi:MAG TPA: Clp protease N-terminal domain-containing protein [Candidatus Dormibacteraeota bacterium]|nr:Clp protease N-terminal domain-containing protein [Candidatus Dormibacteraeota bacterium]
MARATTIRFTDDMYARLDSASSWTGLPVNSIVVAACLEWMSRHVPDPSLSTPGTFVAPAGFLPRQTPPRWATLRRAVKLASGKHTEAFYPFERFSSTAQRMLTAAQLESDKSHHSYIGTEHLLLAAFADPASHAAKILAALNVHEQQVRTTLDKVLGRDQRTIVQKMIPTSRVKKVIEIAFRLCSAEGAPSVSTGHILLALSSGGEGIAAHVLKDLGAPVEKIESALEELTEPEP